MALFLSLLFFEVSTMPYGDCSLSKKARRRRTQAAELGYPGNIHGCCQSACPSILPAENQEKGNDKLLRYRRHALTMTKREAETCRVSWTFFLPYRPNGYADSMATPTVRHILSRRVGLADTAR